MQTKIGVCVYEYVYAYDTKDSNDKYEALRKQTYIFGKQAIKLSKLVRISYLN